MGGEHTFDRCEGIAEAYRSMLLDLEPDVLDGAAAERLLDLVTRVQRTEAVTAARLTRRAAAANRWLVHGDRSPGEWLARRTGTSPGRARRELDVADALATAPATEQALAAGRVSPEQAAEIAAAANVDPAAEASLLAAAPRESFRELQRRARKVHAAATDETARRERIRRRRHLRHWTDDEGAFCFAGRGLPEDGAALLAAVKPHRDAAFAAARQAGQHEPSEAYAFDALLQLVTAPTDGGGRDAGAGAPAPARTPATSGTAPTSSTSTGIGIGLGSGRCGHGDRDGDVTEPTGTSTGNGVTGTDHSLDARDDATIDTGATGPRRDGAAAHTAPRPARAPAQIIVTADLSAMRRGHTIPGETCEIAGVGPIAVSAARDLLGDGFLALVLTDGVDIRNVTHLGRAPTTHQRTALEARGRVCAVPGCGRTAGLEIDHVDGWAVTRRTHLDQLDWLCGGTGGHHHRKTHDGWTLAGPPGNRTWHPPADPATVPAIEGTPAADRGDHRQLDLSTT